MANDLDQHEINEDEPSLTQASMFSDLGTIVSEAFEIKAEVNNDGDLCLLFTEKKNHFTSKEFYFNRKKESPGFIQE